MRREKEVWLEPIDGEDVWFEIRWQFAGVPRVICQASLYDRNNHEEDHYLVNVRKTWAEQGCNPMNVRFNLLVEHAEGYEFERSRGGKWHAAHASIENGQKRINGLPKFRVTDRNSGYKCEIAVFTYPTRDIPDVFSTMPSLHQKPCDNYRGELTPIPDVYSLSNPKDTTERHRFERTAFTGGAHNYLTPWTSHHRWRLVSAWARHCGDRTTNLIATRNVGWLFTKHFDAGGLQEHPKLHSVWPVIRRAISLYLANPKRATMTEALTDEEIDSLQLLSSDWFEFLVGSNVDFEKQIFRETAACFEIDWWLRLS